MEATEVMEVMEVMEAMGGLINIVMNVILLNAKLINAVRMQY